MADSSQLRKLVAYNQWANDKILTSIDGMTAQELARPVDAYFGTIAGNLHHVVWATRIWLARWRGDTPPGRNDPIKGSWREAYAETHADFRAFVESLTDASADRVVAYKDTKGNPYEMVLAQLITHVVNHGAHHRAETGMLLERIDRSPGDMDYVYYCLGR
jgi:uncharacterized damage-inducible protein DinB